MSPDSTSQGGTNQGDPRFGYPRLGTPATEALAAARAVIPVQEPLPDLIEPDAPPVTDPPDDPMIQPDHPRIDAVAHYSLGGWDHAIAATWLRAGVMERLVAAVESLPESFGFLIYDAWRPYALQEELYRRSISDPSVPPNFMSPPSVDSERPAPHESGGAIDLTLTVGGIPIAPGTDFDDPTEAAFADSLDATPGPDREARRMLYWTMRRAGFVVFAGEWWHFEYGTRRWAAITGGTPVYGRTAPS